MATVFVGLMGLYRFLDMMIWVITLIKEGIGGAIWWIVSRVIRRVKSFQGGLREGGTNVSPSQSPNLGQGWRRVQGSGGENLGGRGGYGGNRERMRSDETWKREGGGEGGGGGGWRWEDIGSTASRVGIGLGGGVISLYALGEIHGAMVGIGEPMVSENHYRLALALIGGSLSIYNFLEETEMMYKTEEGKIALRTYGLRGKIMYDAELRGILIKEANKYMGEGKIELAINYRYKGIRGKSLLTESRINEEMRNRLLRVKISDEEITRIQKRIKNRTS